MKVDDSLKSHSEFMEVKRGGIGPVGKYEFGPYKIISARRGITVTKTKSKLFSRISQSETKQKSSFVFTDGGVDTVLVNMAEVTTSVVERDRSAVRLDDGKLKIGPAGDPSVSTGKSFEFVISPYYDTTEWSLGFRKVEDSLGEVHYITTLTDGTTRFDIREITESADGKNSMIWMYHGYEFYRDNKAVAAVQSLSKQYVWLINDLDPHTKFILAAAAATMLFREM